MGRGAAVLMQKPFGFFISELRVKFVDLELRGTPKGFGRERAKLLQDDAQMVCWDIVSCDHVRKSFGFCD